MGFLDKPARYRPAVNEMPLAEQYCKRCKKITTHYSIPWYAWVCTKCKNYDVFGYRRKSS